MKFSFFKTLVLAIVNAKGHAGKPIGHELAVLHRELRSMAISGALTPGSRVCAAATTRSGSSWTQARAAKRSRASQLKTLLRG
jgi:hypothetical protein